ncbi:transketolase family protein [Solibacillus sp. MA9]|uniref:Transketolase family protein n=1 Tax=Solibacillus palustris TaxID=2908203 RepID=A0ABS9UAN5_9BACL|nr:transketolase C-terminal domain-containing protein [Solibacillus sp. MA9]MCH7321396.1 transketolase family protein [Solibacillus sp. MA9]
MKGESLRNTFGQVLSQLVQQDSRVVALDGDLGNSTKLDHVLMVKESAFFQMGIAEQNMVGVAAGLAHVGVKPWVCSFATFLTKRAFDQIVVSVAQTNANVKLIGSYSGLLTSNTGKSHHSLEDLTMFSTIPNMSVIAPADAQELSSAMKIMYETDGPMYLRVSRDETIPPFLGGEPFQLGKGRVLTDGGPILVVSTGTMTYQVKLALEQLQTSLVTHLHMPSIKPFDTELLLEHAALCTQVVTVEEHYIRGGLGGIVAEILSEQNPKYVTRIGVKDGFSGCGTDAELLEANGLSANCIAEAIKKLLVK